MLRRLSLGPLLLLAIMAAQAVGADAAPGKAATPEAVRAEAALLLPADQRPVNWTVLAAGDLRAIFERGAHGIQLVSLFDMAKHRQLLAPRSLPLFEMTMRQMANKQDVSIRSDGKWERVDAQVVEPERKVVLTWQTPQEPQMGPLRVVVEAAADAAAGAIRWKLRVEQVDKAWAVRRVTFPQAALNAQDATLFCPRGCGILRHGPWTKDTLFRGTYPSGWMAMQFMALYDAKAGTGLYVGCHDPYGGAKDLRMQGQDGAQALTLTFDVLAENMDVGGNGYTAPGEVVWQALHGDWYDAARLYRAWVRQHAKWFPQLTAEGRADTPLWLRELPVWLNVSGKPAEVVPATENFLKAVGTPLGIHWYCWHQIPFDNDYPHYFPTVAGFAEAVAKLQAENVAVMPYINGRLWDMRDKGAEDFEFTKKALSAATKQEDGRPFTEKYGSKEADGSPVELGVMCPTTPLWQKTIREIVLRLMNECGVRGVYIDQIAAADPVPCQDPSHGHPTGGGHWWNEGYWQMLQAIRQAKPADRFLTTECNGEPFAHCFDGYLTWHWGYDGQVAAFPAIYGGALQMFGRAYRGCGTNAGAVRMQIGQQLVFGEQLGWFPPDVMNNQAAMPLVKQAVRLRWQLRRYFYAGEMLRPPKLRGDMPKVSADWAWDSPGTVTTDAVLTGAWRLPQDKRCVLLFVNVSEQPVTAEVQVNGAEYGLSRTAKVRVWTADGAQDAEAWPVAVPRKVTVPAQSMLAWELSE